jgi:hypothetical protein
MLPKMLGETVERHRFTEGRGMEIQPALDRVD